MIQHLRCILIQYILLASVDKMSFADVSMIATSIDAEFSTFSVVNNITTICKLNVNVLFSAAGTMKKFNWIYKLIAYASSNTVRMKAALYESTDDAITATVTMKTYGMIQDKS